MSEEFNFEESLKALQSGQSLTGKDGILTPLIKKLTEAALAAELDSHLAQEVITNRKNGTTKKRSKPPAVTLNYPHPETATAVLNLSW